jgi:hypothetical protein
MNKVIVPTLAVNLPGEVNMKKTVAVVVVGMVSWSWSFAADPVGKVISVKGEAYIAHLLKAKIPAVVGEDIFSKDKIKTGPDGEVVIDMLGESKLTVGADSYMTLPKKTNGSEAGTELALYGGKVNFEVKPLGDAQTFTVRSPSAVAGVRGTIGEMSFDMESGVTGAQSLPHTDGTDAKSIVYTAPPEQKDAMTNAILESKSEGSDGGQAQGHKDLLVVNEGQASFHMADGDAVLVDIAPGENLRDAGNKVAQDIKDGKAVDQAKSRFANMDAARVAYLEDLERRLENIEASRVDLRLPTPGQPPQN